MAPNKVTFKSACNFGKPQALPLLAGPWTDDLQNQRTCNPKPPKGSNKSSPTLRVHVPNNRVPGVWVIVIIVQVLGKYMIIRYLDP